MVEELRKVYRKLNRPVKVFIESTSNSTVAKLLERDVPEVECLHQRVSDYFG